MQTRVTQSDNIKTETIVTHKLAVKKVKTGFPGPQKSLFQTSNSIMGKINAREIAFAEIKVRNSSTVLGFKRRPPLSPLHCSPRKQWSPTVVLLRCSLT